MIFNIPWKIKQLQVSWCNYQSGVIIFVYDITGKTLSVARHNLCLRHNWQNIFDYQYFQKLKWPFNTLWTRTRMKRAAGGGLVVELCSLLMCVGERSWNVRDIPNGALMGTRAPFLWSVTFPLLILNGWIISEQAV